MGRSRPDVLFARFRRTGDPRALARLFDLTAPELFRVAVYLAGDRNRGEDLVQATFLAAIEGKAGFVDGKPVLPWLLAILANRARLARREAARHIDPARLPAPPTVDPVAAAEHSEFAQSLHRALRGLQEPYRQVLLLHLEHGLSAKEIADTLARPGGTVRTQIVRGMEILRGALPVGFVAGALVVATPGQGLAAVKAALLASIGATAPPALTVASLGGILLMKKPLTILAVTLLACAGVLFELLRASSAQPAPGPDLPASRLAAKEVPPTRPPGTGRGSAEEEPSSRSASGRVALGDPLTPGTGGLNVLEIPTGVRVEGRVVDSKQRPIAGARICVSAPIAPPAGHAEPGSAGASDSSPSRCAELTRGFELATTDASGSFAVPSLEPGRSLVAVAAGRIRSRWKRIPTAATGRESVTLELEDRGSSVSGIVYQPDGSPLSGACVRVQDPHEVVCSVRTDERGGFLAEGIQPGSWVPVLVEAPGFFLWREVLLVREAHAARVTARLRIGATVRGQVRSAAGAPVAGARISAFQEGDGGGPELRPLTRTDAQGRFAAAGFLPGRLKLQAQAGDQWVVGHVELVDGQESTWDGVLGSLQVIQGTVVDSKGAALMGWRVRADGGRGVRRCMDAVTDARGSFRLEGCEASAYQVHVFAKNACTNLPAITVDDVLPGGPSVQVIVPEERLPSSWLTGVLVDAEGRPVTGGAASLVLRRVLDDGSTEAFGGMTWENGRFRLGPVAAGTWAVELEWERVGCVALGSRKLEAGRTCDLGTVRGARPGFVQLQARDAEGEPLPRATFAVFRGERFVTEIYVLAGRGDSGRSPALWPGTYRICTYDSARLPKWSREVEVRADEVALVEAALPPAVVRLVRSPAAKNQDTWIVETWRRPSGEVVHVLQRSAGSQSSPYLREERFIPGTYEVEIKDLLGHSAKTTFVIDDQADSDQVLELPFPSELRR